MDLSTSTSIDNLTFSIIIPTYYRPQALTRCLDSLSRLDYARNSFEVIVVDDGSPVSLEPIVKSFQDGMTIRLIRQSNAGPAAARNKGAFSAKGKFLAFTDDDCVSDPGWLTELAKQLRNGPNRMVGGRVVNELHENVFSSASQLIIDIVYAHYNADPGRAVFFASNNMAVSADTFHALSGFDPAFRTSEDRELCNRWREKGFQMIFAPNAVIHHAHSLTLKTFWNQHMSYGRGAFMFNRTYASRGCKGSTLTCDFYIAFLRLFSNSIKAIPRLCVCRLAFLMAIWQIANTAGFVSAALKYMTIKQNIR
jgi:GT2 family glycosyltransferase